MQEDMQAADGAGSLQVEQLAARLIKSEADIETLRKDAVETTHRAGVTDGRADGDRRRIEVLEARAVMDRDMLDELRAEGVIQRDHAANLELALQSARLIGAAVGIVMAKCSVTEVISFEMLKRMSQDTNRRLRAVAEEIVATGDVSQMRRRGKET
jgi:ANTAR domain